MAAPAVYPFTTFNFVVAITRDGVLVIHHDLTLNPDLGSRPRSTSSPMRRSTRWPRSRVSSSVPCVQARAAWPRSQHRLASS